MLPKYPLQKYVDLIELSGLQEIVNDVLNSIADAEDAFQDEEWLEMEAKFKEEGRKPTFPSDYPPFKYALANRISISLNIIYKDAIESFNQNLNGFVDGRQKQEYLQTLLRKATDLHSAVYHNHKEVYGASLIQESLDKVISYFRRDLAEELVKIKAKDTSIKQKLRTFLKILTIKDGSETGMLKDNQLEIVLEEIADIIENKKLPKLNVMERFQIEISNIEFISFLFHEVNTAFSKNLPTGELSKLLPEYLIGRFENYAGMQPVTITKKWSPGGRKDAYKAWKKNLLGEKGE